VVRLADYDCRWCPYQAPIPSLKTEHEARCPQNPEGGTTMRTTPTTPIPSRGELLTPGEVARIFRVDPKTVARWAKAGRIESIRTLGGHRRFSAATVRRLIAEGASHGGE
jgi:excisionase family DNA binding protein